MKRQSDERQAGQHRQRALVRRGEQTQAAMSPARILLADDNLDFLNAAASFLTDSASVEIVGLARNGWEALQLTTALAPDLVLMDLSMPEPDTDLDCREGLSYRFDLMFDVPRLGFNGGEA